MSIETISLKNFRSYKNQVIHSLNPKLNVILGKNGRGKSNFLKSILFLFSDKILFNQNQKTNLIYSGITNQIKDDLEVQIVINNISRKLPIQNDYVKITRRWNVEDKQQYFIDSKSANKTQISSIVDCLGMSFTNPYNIVQQGKIRQIANMDDHEFYKLLQESTGIRKYYKKRQEAIQNLNKVQKQKQEASQILNDLGKKFQSIKHKKHEFEIFEKEQKNKKYKNIKQIEMKMGQVQKKLLGLKNQYKKIKTKNNQLQMNKQKQLIQLQDLKEKVKINTQKLLYYNQQDVTNLDIDDSVILTQKTLEKTENQLKKFEKKYGILQQDLQKHSNLLQKQKNQFEAIKQQYQILKVDYDIATNKQRQNMILNSINQYAEEIKSQKQSIQTMKTSLNQIKKLLNKSSVKSDQSNQINKFQKQIQTKKNELKSVHQLQKQIKIKQIEFNRKKNQNLIQYDSDKMKFQKNSMKFSNRIGFLVNFDLLQIIQKNKLQGVYGYFIDYVKIKQVEVGFAYQIAAKNKFFSLIVQNADVAKKVIKLNKQIKGKQINIFNLSFLRKQIYQKRKYPNGQDVVSLLNPDWIEVTKQNSKQLPEDFYECIQKLLNNSLCKYIFVQNYNSALRYAKQYHLNCITSDQEIVYADAQLCRIGQPEIIGQNRLELYKNLVLLRNKLKNAKINIQQEQKRYDEIQNKEVELMQQQKILNEKIKKIVALQTQLREAYDHNKKFQKQKQKIEKMIQKSQQIIAKKEQAKKNLQLKKNKKIQIPKDYVKFQQSYKSKSKKINQMLEILFQKQRQLNNIREQKQKLTQVLKLHSNSEQQSIMLPIKTISITNNLKNQIDEIQKKIEYLSSNQFNINQYIQKYEQQQVIIEQKISNLELERNQLFNKKQQLGQGLMQIQQDQEESNNSNMNSNRKIHYTTKDKIFFSKFAQIYTKFTEFSTRFQQIIKNQNILRNLIIQFDNQANNSMATIVQKFQTEFKFIMKKLVPQGSCQVRLKKISDRSRNSQKLKNALDIKVNFQSSRDLRRKWNQFSGGQKTVIAIALIMAIQKCDPAPFYIFDEIDSALDPVYRGRIAELILQNSQKAQYFVTSFKNEFTSFSDNQCNYYQVINQQRKSHLHKINQQTAQNLLKRIEFDNTNQ